MRVPLSIVTGFLGSGKTTLLNAIVRSPTYSKSALVINEFGDVGVDHRLVEASSDQVVLLESGCICCTLNTDLTEAVTRLDRQQTLGRIPQFNRLIVETSGLSRPSATIASVMSEPALARRFQLDGVLTVVDALHIARQLQDYPEAEDQVLSADHLLFSKMDIAQLSKTELAELMSRLNPSASQQVVEHGECDLTQLFNRGVRHSESGHWQVAKWLPALTIEQASAHQHSAMTVSLQLPDHYYWSDLHSWLQSVQLVAGDQLLRIKGIVKPWDQPGCLAVHGVHHLLHPPVLLPDAAIEQGTHCLVLIGRELNQLALQQSLDDIGQSA